MDSFEVTRGDSADLAAVLGTAIEFLWERARASTGVVRVDERSGDYSPLRTDDPLLDHGFVMEHRDQSMALGRRRIRLGASGLIAWTAGALETTDLVGRRVTAVDRGQYDLEVSLCDAAGREVAGLLHDDFMGYTDIAVGEELDRQHVIGGLGYVLTRAAGKRGARLRVN